MPRYLYHAPDGHVYGPVPYETLQRWRQEGRLRDHDPLRTEETPKTGPFLTYSEIIPPPPAKTEPLDDSSEPDPLPPEIVTQNNVPALLTDAWDLYKKGFAVMLPLALVMQAPVQLFNIFFPSSLDPVTGAPIWAHKPAAWALLAVALVVLVLAEAALTLLFATLDHGEAPSLSHAIKELRGRIWPLLWTQILRACILLSWVMLSGFFITMALGAKGWLRPLAVGVAALSICPTLLLALRYMIVPQVVLLEGLKGLAALRRAGDLVRFSSRDGLFSAGDLRLLLGILPWLLFNIGVSMLSVSAEKFPWHPYTASELVIYLGTSLAVPFLIAFFVVFVFDARRRFRAAAVE